VPENFPAQNAGRWLKPRSAFSALREPVQVVAAIKEQREKAADPPSCSRTGTAFPYGLTSQRRSRMPP
jgi:hypothetical protein